MSASATKKLQIVQNQKLSFAQKFDPKGVMYGAHAFTGQFSPRTFNLIVDFANGLQNDKTNVDFVEGKAPDQNRKLHAGWHIAFDAMHVSDASSYGYGISRLELASFSAFWMPATTKGFSMRGSSGTASASALAAARRQTPILFNENHLRDRLRVRMKGDETPAQKFMSLMESELVGTALLYLEAAKMEVFAGKQTVKIAIPLNEGLLIGDLEKGKLPETKNMVVEKGHKINRVPTSPPQDYDHHIVLRTWIDYNGLNKPKEEIYKEIGEYGDQKETELAAGDCAERFFGIHSNLPKDDDPRNLEMMTDAYIRVVGNKHDRAEVQKILCSHKAVAERVEKLCKIAVWANNQLVS